MTLHEEITRRAETIRTHPTALALLVDTGEQPDVREMTRFGLELHLELLEMILALSRAVDELGDDCRWR